MLIDLMFWVLVWSDRLVMLVLRMMWMCLWVRVFFS